MSLFAELNDANTVIRVIVADQGFVDAIGGRWVETSEDGSLCKNYAGVGHTYDEALKAFVEPQPFKSWVLDEQTCKWVPPTPKPVDKTRFDWDEKAATWTASIEVQT